VSNTLPSSHKRRRLYACRFALALRSLRKGYGLGAATAVGLARRGVSVCINFNSSADAANDVVAQCQALGVEAFHHYSDALTSAAAFVGISIALVGGKGYEAADDWAALLACVVIAVNGVTMFNRAVGDVMDTAVAPEVENEVRKLALSVTGVSAIDKCRVRKSGLSHLVDIHVRVHGELSVRVGHDIAHAVKDTLMASGTPAITDVAVHIEPAD